VEQLVVGALMRIALVALPNPILASPTAHFQQGLLYVGGALRRAGHEVEIVDLRAKETIAEDDIPEAEVVGVTATSGEFEFAKQVARIARSRGARTMIGGAHATFMPEDCREHFDLVVRGDGEVAAVEALAHGSTKGTFEHSLESLAGYFPEWPLIGAAGLSRELFTGAGYGQGPLAAGILSSRGCGHHCSYCRSDRDKVRLRPIADVVAEINFLKFCGVTHFRFYDENITNPKPRALELFRALEPLGIHFRAHTRSDAIDDELATAFKRAGGEELGFGFEAASDHVLEKVRKHETVAQHREAVRVCKRHGIICKAFWMVGLPGQKWPEIDDIKRFMADEAPDRWIVSVFSPYPGCDVWARPEEYSVAWMDRDLSHYWNFPEKPCIAYTDNSAKDIERQYHDLVTFLDYIFPRGQSGKR
jgi:radical SAM superfamily enzyme YgiQ (UPF0313 family)